MPDPMPSIVCEKSRCVQKLENLTQSDRPNLIHCKNRAFVSGAGCNFSNPTLSGWVQIYSLKARYNPTQPEVY